VRIDKPGVGESEGDCGKSDFIQELTGYQSAFDEMLKYDFIDPERIVVIGLSNGGGTAPLVPRQHPVRGYVAASSWGRTMFYFPTPLSTVARSSRNLRKTASFSGVASMTSDFA
jgi:pimeloyl-ACP methyl ester carboxylesterase